jgi:hypothetical protein
MTTALAHAAVEIVLLLSAGSFQAVLPQLSPTASPPFADTKAGAAAFIDWLKPQFPKGRWNPPPTQLCVVGLVPFADGKAPWVSQPIAASNDAFHILEPYGATFHYITPEQQAQGLKKRTLQQALALCAKAPKPKWEPPPPPPRPKRL